jgi:xyloglucan-specific exo-beta-1,4-glucanase
VSGKVSDTFYEGVESESEVVKWFFVPILLAIAVVLNACQLGPPVAQESLSSEASYTWKNVKMNGMGFVTGLEIHPTTPNLVYIRTDVGGIFRWYETDKSWIPLSDRFSTLEKGQSVESLALDAQQPKLVYFAADGNIYKSTDRGKPLKPWQIVPLRDSNNERVYMNGNGVWRGMGERLAVDPNNSNVVYFGSREQGLFRSNDGGTSWNNSFRPPQDAFEPRSKSDRKNIGIGIVFIAFDPSSKSNTDRSQVIYLGVAGSGIYRSQNAGATWENISSALPNDSYPARFAMSKIGTLYVTYLSPDYKRATLWRFRAGAWKNVSPANVALGPSISIDPSNEANLLAYGGNGSANTLLRSSTSGDSWQQTRITTQVPSWWPSYFAVGLNNQYTGPMRYDPHVRGRAWVTDGYGVLRADNIAQPTFVAQMNNLEEMCIIALKSAPSGAPLFTGTADNHGFRHSDVNIMPSQTFTRGEFGITTGIDFFAKDPNIIVRVGSDQNNSVSKRGVSYDNGQTWYDFTAPRSISPGSTAEAFDGNIALSSSNNRLWVWAPNPGYNGRAFGVYLTTDAGQSWKEATGINNPSYNPALAQPWFTSQVLTADPVLADTFYFYQSVSNVSGTWTAGIIYRGKVENGNLNFSRVSSGVLPEDYRAELKAAPNMTGELWFTNKGPSEPAERRGGRLFRSSDGGATWSEVSGFSKTRSVAFGKPVSGTKPIVFVYGIRNGAEGIWRSDNATSATGNASSATWVKISGITPTFGNLTVLEGDKQIPGRVYAGTGCRGAWVGQPN